MKTDLETYINMGIVTDTRPHGLYVIGSSNPLKDTPAYRLFQNGQVLFGGKPFTAQTIQMIIKTMGAQ